MAFNGMVIIIIMILLVNCCNKNEHYATSLITMIAL